MPQTVLEMIRAKARQLGRKICQTESDDSAWILPLPLWSPLLRAITRICPLGMRCMKASLISPTISVACCRVAEGKKWSV